MKRKSLLILSLLLLLTACGQSPPVPPDDAFPSYPVAPVEGETVSPDGRFEIRVEGKRGQPVSGIQPPEFLQIIDRETKEVLWQDQGWVSQSVRWSPDSAYVALAYAARTWEDIKIIETDAWTAWDFTLPDGSFIPEYIFLPDDWGAWQSENCLELTVGGTQDGEDAHLYRCIVQKESGKLKGSSWEITKERLPKRYDFNHDGKPETLERTTVWFPGMTGAAVDTYVLSVLDEAGNTLWQDYAGTSHAGENSLYAFETGGADYLLRYHPYMGQGICTYHYEIFSLDETGAEVMLRENNVEFSMDGSGPAAMEWDTAEVAAFLEDVHQYIDNAELLVNTAPGDLFFLDYDGTLTLEENLRKYKESLEAF